MLKRVLDELRVSMICEASSELSDDPRQPFGLAQKQTTPIGGDITAVERGDDLARTKDGKIQVGYVGVVERDFRDRPLAICTAPTGTGRFRARVGITLCHCRVSFLTDVCCLPKYIYV